MFLKPYSERINQLESVNNKLIEENKNSKVATEATGLNKTSVCDIVRYAGKPLSKIKEDKIIKIGFIPAFLPLVASFLYDQQGFGVIFFVGFFVILFFINKFLKNSAIVSNN